MPEVTPMMQQYLRIKQEHTDSILFFRLGDFYEMFQRDAQIASSILGLTLTKRNGVPMCGIPYHAARSYIGRLLGAGKKIAICEQVKLPQDGRGIAERRVVEIITPGTVVDEDYLDRSENNYLAAIGCNKDRVSFSYIDLSTGEFFATTIAWKDKSAFLRKELLRLKPREIIIQESFLEENSDISKIVKDSENIVVNRYPDWFFDLRGSRERLCRFFDVQNLKGFGLNDEDTEIIASGVILDYVHETSKSLLPHVRTLTQYGEEDFLSLDESAIKNLEIINNLQDGGKNYTLLSVLNHTKTSMGSRLLRKWLIKPLVKKDEILGRSGRVESLYRNQTLLSTLREKLSRIFDLERLTSRVAMDKAHAKDLLAVRFSIENTLEIMEILSDWYKEKHDEEIDKIESQNARSLMKLLESSIDDDPSILLTEGRMIRRGYDQQLDELHSLKTSSKNVLDSYLNTEKEKSGINNLKIRYNRIIGYYLEVTKSNSGLVPPHFIKRQSLVNSERYTTDRLIELETSLNSASERIIDLEKELFLEIRDKVKKEILLLKKLSTFVSTVDVTQSLAQAATVHGYTKPEITETGEISIIEGRHPVVEAYIPSGEFIPNDISINNKEGHFIIVTGPNMAGKSTYLRQAALIVLMAQIGSFVPAKESTVSIVDKIFCRIGASDNLARGESTFLVEMSEAAFILRTATSNSLIIMDEVGRGTGTKDGVAIAWAISEYILHHVKAKTLFATHYHELTLLNHEQVQNLSLDVLREKEDIIFLKKIKKGPAGASYGIHVAKLAGIPLDVTQRAASILEELEEKPITPEASPKTESTTSQPLLFDPLEIVRDEITSVDIDNVTPLQALEKIAEWQKELKS